MNASFSLHIDKEFQKQRNHDVNECEFVASEVDCRALMELSFVYISIWYAHHCRPFPGLKYITGPDWCKFFFLNQ